MKTKHGTSLGPSFKKMTPRQKLAIGAVVMILLYTAKPRSSSTAIAITPVVTAVAATEQSADGGAGWAGSFLFGQANQAWNAYMNAVSSQHRYLRCPVYNLYTTLAPGTNATWFGIDQVEATLDLGSSKSRPLEAKVDRVPCKSGGCCSHIFSFRYNSTDIKVFDQVFRWHYMRYLYPMTDVFTPKYILDAGANGGFSTSLFKSLWPDAIVVSLEPDPTNFAALVRNTKQYDGVQAVNAGLWSKKATIGMVSEHGDWGKIFVEVPPGTEGALDAYGVADIAAKFDIPAFDFIKIDIEGAEGMVFEPDADFSWIQTTKLLSLEVHDYFAPHFGLTEVSTRIEAALKDAPFTLIADNEHVMYLAHDITRGFQALHKQQQAAANAASAAKDAAATRALLGR